MSVDTNLFLASVGVVVAAALLVWRPYRAGRRPLAIYDQLSAYSVAMSIGATAIKRHGVELWLVGASAALGGFAACGLVDLLSARYPNRVQSHLPTFYLGTSILCICLTLLGAIVAERMFLLWV